ncbi:MAG TPA: hypothetical protein VLV83_21535 [Acidobacteriota bacterium]|nr:hypothetical protein [Acidobacteriota bacterium]
MAARRYIAVFVTPPEPVCGQSADAGSAPAPVFSITTELLELARDLTPRLERLELADGRGEGVLLEATPRSEPEMLQRLSLSLAPEDESGSPQDPLPLRLWASASTRTAALLAALNGVRGRLDPERQQSFLQELPVEALSLLESSLGPQEEQILHTWGIRTLDDLSCLPKGQLAARLGSAGPRLQALARGDDLRPFQAWTPPDEFSQRRDLDWRLDSLEPLSFALHGMMETLCRRLQSRGLAAESLTLQLGLDEGEVFTRTLHLAFPLKSAKVMHSLLRLDLQERPLESGIHWLELRLKPTPARTLQFSLLQETSADPERLSRTLARLTALVGEDKVGCPRPLDTHRPDAFEMRPLRLDGGRRKKGRRKKSRRKGEHSSKNGCHENHRFLPAAALGHRAGPLDLGSAAAKAASSPAGEKPIQCAAPAPVLRRCRPPAPVEIERGEIVHCAGPWEASGDWWCDDRGYRRQQYDVELKNGALLRLFRQPACEGWLLEGVYD